MIRRFFFFLLVALIAFFGFVLGQVNGKKEPAGKSFVFILYAHNDAISMERVLNSLFEQKQHLFRLIIVDDASDDGTFDEIQRYALEHHCEEQILLIKNEEKLGKQASIHRALEQCREQEVALPMAASDWV